jgi:hypothetical protein
MGMEGKQYSEGVAITGVNLSLIWRGYQNVAMSGE